MADDRSPQVEELTGQLRDLEKEGRRLLAALGRGAMVRNILFLGLLIFAGVFGYLFYALYKDLQENKLDEIRALLEQRQDEFLEPLTRESFALAEEVGPEVLTVFRERANGDAARYLDAFNAERDLLVNNLDAHLKSRLEETYQQMFDEHAEFLRTEFPDLSNEQKMQLVQDNMKLAYEQIGKRYYVDFFRTELQGIMQTLDTFPPSEPDPSSPVVEQIGSEMLEMVQMMLAQSDRYSAEEEAARPDPATSQEPSKDEGDAQGSGEAAGGDGAAKQDSDGN